MLTRFSFLRNQRFLHLLRTEVPEIMANAMVELGASEFSLNDEKDWDYTQGLDGKDSCDSWLLCDVCPIWDSPNAWVSRRRCFQCWAAEYSRKCSGGAEDRQL